jgi:hypothetical protein
MRLRLQARAGQGWNVARKIETESVLSYGTPPTEATNLPKYVRRTYRTGKAGQSCPSYCQAWKTAAGGGPHKPGSAWAQGEAGETFLALPDYALQK